MPGGAARCRADARHLSYFTCDTTVSTRPLPDPGREVTLAAAVSHRKGSTMGTILLILGVVLWWVPHLWKRAAPSSRAGWGEPGKGLVAGLLAVSVLLMVLGFRWADGPVWWGPSPALKGINNLLVLAAIYLFAASGMKTRAGLLLRHPQLIGFALWAFAHLLVNGDLPSLILFGGLLAWAVVEIAVINRAGPGWQPDRAAASAVPARKEVMAAVGAVVVFAALGLIHGWLGPNPFGG